MKIKAFLQSGRFKFIKVDTFSDLKEMVNEYERWEYVEWVQII